MNEDLNMKIYFFHRGEFTESDIEYPEGMEWQQWLDRQGFYQHASESDGLSYDIHTAREKGSGLGFAFFALGDDRIIHVIAVDGIDYLDLYARWIPAFRG